MTVLVISERAKWDKERYHPANQADYASTIGMPHWDGRRWLYYCVGCWYCEGVVGKDIVLDVDTETVPLEEVGSPPAQGQERAPDA